MERLTEFSVAGQTYAVEYIETQQVKAGVECDIYCFSPDTTRDLAIVKVAKGYKTPLQRVLSGEHTIEGYYSGKGILTVTNGEGKLTRYEFPGNSVLEIDVSVGDTMQWIAIEDLLFYELCTPPYEDGRFEDLAEA